MVNAFSVFDSIPKVKKFAYVMEIEDGESREEADEHCGRGIRAPF
jgi:hypothetical protein